MVGSVVLLVILRVTNLLFKRLFVHLYESVESVICFGISLSSFLRQQRDMSLTGKSRD